MSATPEPNAAERPRAVIVRATSETLPGSTMKVAGLTVAERAVRQWARVPGASVEVLSDGSVPLPAAPGPRVAVHDAGSVRDPAARFGAAAEDVLPANLVDPAGRPRTGGAPVLVTDEPSRRRAEDAIFAELLRGDLGLAARWLNKPLSLRITRHLLCRLPVTPNQVTVGSALIGLCGCALIATGSYAAVVVGFLLAHLQSVLDGCDGELARVRFQQSAIGEWLDTVADDALNLALIGALALALRNPARGGPPGGPLLAVLAGLMLLSYNVVAYRELIRLGEGGEVLKVRWWFARGGDMKAMAGQSTRSPAAFLYNLGRRDVFVFVWFLFALVDRLDLVLYFALIVAGTSFFVAAGQVLSRTRSSSGH
jgi:1L-myo-inositol 1-phosphate cytidylyltransferase / CDP-L-myo-inositol myo-inositolphosphotransferase